MSVIKQISVYNGSSWNTDDIGADASNVTLSSNIAGSTNLNTALSNILPASQLTASRVLISDANKKIVASDITSTQLGYLSGVTSNIQTQINRKAPTSHASTTTTYGRASQDYYGHAKINNTLTVSTHQVGVGLSAYQGYLLDQNKLNKSGGTMSGALNISRSGNNANKFSACSSNITTGSTKSQVQYGNEYCLYDSRNRLYGLFRGYQHTDGTVNVGIYAANTTTTASTNSISTNLYIGVKRDGTKHVVLDQAPWRSALGISCTPTATSLSMASNISGVANITKDNTSKTVRLMLSFACSSSVAAGGLIATIPTGYRINGGTGSSNLWIPGIGRASGNNAVTGCGFTVQPDGKILNNSTNGALVGGFMVGEYYCP